MFHGFTYYSKEQQLKTILNDENLINNPGDFLLKALELRRFLSEKHKNVI